MPTGSGDIDVADGLRPGATLRIRSGVARVRRSNGTLLVSPGDGRALRISPVAEDLLPLLAAGAAIDTLEQRLRQRHPAALDVGSKLRRFLAQLADAGLLEHAAVARSRRVPARFPLFETDGTARRAAAAISRLPLPVAAAILLLALVAAVGAIAAVCRAGRLPHPLDLFRQFAPAGLALFALVVVPLHEAAHAVACRLAGAPSGKAGIILHGWVMPGPYVDTSRAYVIAGRMRRASIAAAGPLVDLLATGIAAAWLMAGGGRVAQTLFLLSAIFFVLDTLPLTPSDGSRALEALLDDDLARTSALSPPSRRGRLSGMREIALYRVATSMHVQTVAVASYLWWTTTVPGAVQ